MRTRNVSPLVELRRIGKVRRGIVIRHGAGVEEKVLRGGVTPDVRSLS